MAAVRIKPMEKSLGPVTLGVEVPSTGKPPQTYRKAANRKYFFTLPGIDPRPLEAMSGPLPAVLRPPPLHYMIYGSPLLD